jgi:hypothetical protein
MKTGGRSGSPADGSPEGSDEREALEGTPTVESAGRDGLTVGCGNFGLTAGGSSGQNANRGEFCCLMAIPCVV